MGKNKKGAKKKAQAWGDVRLGSFNMSFPKPRIPRLLGAAVSLPAGSSVYPRIKLDVPITAQSVSIAAGAAATSIALDTTLINNFSTRFATLFREYCVVGAALELRICDVTNPCGIAAAYIDEKSGASPTANEAENRARLDMMVVQMTTVKPYRLNWCTDDYLDLQWSASGVNTTDAWAKIFASSSSTGTTSSTAGVVLITGTLAFEFRGYS